MTELDFDELDKAVNSLMADKGGNEASEPDTASPRPITSVSTTLSPAPSTPVPPAVRRRGQFMDVIRPSSANRQAMAQTSGQGRNITPLTMQASSTPDLESSTSVTTPDNEELPTTAPYSMSDTELMKQPNVGFPAEDTSPDVAAPSPDEAEKDTQLPSLDDELDDNPQTSPFLPDAKVEKRPLGNPATEQALTPSEELSLPEAPGLASNVQSDDDATSTVMTDAKEPEQSLAQLPDELQHDVVAVEANDVMHEDGTPEETAEPTPTTESAPDTSTISAAIAQQYEEQPSTGDQTNGAIYDTSTYHQPLEAQANKKKSSTLVWVLWIVVLLIVGATAGAAWFYFTTQ